MSDITPPTSEELKARLEELSFRLANAKREKEPPIDLAPHAWPLLKFRFRNATYKLRQRLRGRGNPWFLLQIFRRCVRTALFIGAGLLLFYELREWHDDRLVRNWQLLATNTPGNGGKTEALKFLSSEYGCLPFDWSLPLMGNCWKGKSDLTGINLSKETNNGSVILSNTQLSAIDFRGSNLDGIVIDHAVLERINFDQSSFAGARISKSDFEFVSFRGANLRDSVWVDFQFDGVNVLGAQISGAVFFGTKGELEALRGTWAWADKKPLFVNTDNFFYGLSDFMEPHSDRVDAWIHHAKPFPRGIVPLRLSFESREEFIVRMRKQPSYGPHWLAIRPEMLGD